MNLMIKGMEMPECCEVCPCYNWIEDICRITESPNDFSDARIEDCPLAKIPTPHGDLIDRDVLLNEYKEDLEEEKEMMKKDLRAYLLMYDVVDVVVENIQSIPAVIKAEVNNDNP